MTSATATQTAVRFFDELSRADVAYAGGKGANLGELTAAGLPVPPGFVVGAPAYAAFCDESGLRERLASALDGRRRRRHRRRWRRRRRASATMVEAKPMPGVARGRDRRGLRGARAGDERRRRSPCAPRRPPRTPSRRRSPA